MYCQHCGKEIPDNAQYCPDCGTKVLRYGQDGKKKSADPMDILEHKSTNQPPAPSSGLNTSLTMKTAVAFVLLIIAISLLSR